jgi:hypothetical protein
MYGGQKVMKLEESALSAARWLCTFSMVLASLIWSQGGYAAAICNKTAPSTRVNNVPGIQASEIVAELPNGPKVQVLDSFTDGTGTEYAHIEFVDPVSKSNKTGFVSKMNLAELFCSAQYMLPPEYKSEAADKATIPPGDEVISILKLGPLKDSGWRFEKGKYSNTLGLLGDARAEYSSGEDSLGISLGCDEEMGQHFLALRLPKGKMRDSLWAKSEIGVTITDDQKGEWVSYNGEKTSAPGLSNTGKFKLVADPSNSHILIAYQIDKNSKDRLERVPIYHFYSSKSKTTVEFFDAKYENKPQEEDIFLSVEIPSKGSTSAIKAMFKTCGIDYK